MPIITIYQGASGYGGELAENVASTLGCRCVSREVLLEVCARYGIAEAKLNEILEREPRWWQVWLEDSRPYRIALQAALCELAQGGRLVYHGHLGHELLPGISHVIKVLLTAPMEVRIEQVRARLKVDEAAARHHIEEVDKARARRLMSLFDADPRDASRYDIVLNMGRMSLKAAETLLVTAARLEDYQPTAGSEPAFRDLLVASRVEAALMTSPRLRHLVVRVKANQGQVTLSGVLSNWDTEEEIKRIAEGVPDVTKVTTDFIVSAALESVS